MSSRVVQVNTVFAPLALEIADDCVTGIRLGDTTGEKPSSTFDRLVAQELVEYGQGVRRDFSFPIQPAGSSFFQQVWTALRQIPYGETRSYGQIARELDQPGASRAVGLANNRNPIPIVIPCHRVIAADGSLCGFGGGLKLKRTLLEIEGAITPEFALGQPS